MQQGVWKCNWYDGMVIMHYGQYSDHEHHATTQVDNVLDWHSQLQAYMHALMQHSAWEGTLVYGIEIGILQTTKITEGLVSITKFSRPTSSSISDKRQSDLEALAISAARYILDSGNVDFVTHKDR